jgi:predicted sulfurtransferase
VIAEWRDPETLFKDHIDNAVIEAMLEASERGRDLNYSRYQLPLARIAKLYSQLLNVFGRIGPVPEGMSATAGLRNNQLSEDHQAIKEEVELMAMKFKKQHNYTAPFWQLLDFSRKVMLEMNE